MLESCAEVSVCRSVKVSGRALALRDAHLRSTHGAWRPGDGVRATPHRPHRFAAKICADLLSARDAGTCGASARTSCQTAFGRVDEDGVWLSTHRIGGSVPCRAERQEVHADIALSAMSWAQKSFYRTSYRGPRSGYLAARSGNYLRHDF